ncbi:MAG: B12-binding domain-containing radical SAM protein [Acidimicrobiales bacterium]
MTDVLLAHAYFLRFDSKQAQKMRPYPPLATLYVAANLRQAGWSVAVFDAMLAESEASFEAALAQHRPPFVVLYEDNFNFLSKMCLVRMREAALTMAAAAARAGAYVIAAGSDVTDRPELYLAGGVDLAVLGEGDHTVREVLEWAAAGRPPGERPAHLAGLAYAEAAPAGRGGAPAVIRTAKRANERRPDVFPHPARDLIDVGAYRRAWLGRHGRFSLNMVSTRGCPFHCNWCAKPIWGQRYAMRSPADVADELAEVKRTYRPDHVWFADDIFGLRPAWVAEFAAEVGARDARVPFTIQSRCDLMTEQAVAGLAAAGCEEVWLGAESGSQPVLDAMDKGITVAQIRTARERLGRAGIAVGFFIQFGYPGERLADIRATVELVREALPDQIGVSVSYPLPGTRFHDLVADQLGGKANWEESGDLDMMFQGAYTTPFYRRLHVALHDDLDLHRRKAGLAPAPHPSLAPVDLDTQGERVTAAWAELDELELSCRNAKPTLLLRAAAAPPAPDLSRPYN